MNQKHDKLQQSLHNGGTHIDSLPLAIVIVVKLLELPLPSNDKYNAMGLTVIFNWFMILYDDIIHG